MVYNVLKYTKNYEESLGYQYMHVVLWIQAIQRDVGLRVAALCGESVTLKMIKSFYDDSFDVVVVTAGALGRTTAE